MSLRADGWCVYVRNSVVELVERAKSRIHIPRVDRRRQSVFHVVVHGKSLVRVLHSDYGKNRTEDFFLLETAARLDVGEDRRLEEIPFRELFRSLTSGKELRAFRLTDADIGLDFSEGILVDERAHIGSLLPSVAQLECPGPVLEHTDKLVVNFLVYDKTTGSGTTLPRRAESAPERAFEGQIEVCIVHHDLGVLAPHLQRQPR